MGALRIEEAYPRYSYEDYKNWEDRWEIIDGIAYAMSPMPMIKHQRIVNKIGWELENAFKDCKKCQVLQPVDWKIDEYTVVQPDNLVICYEPENEAYLTKAPEIIFEVLSKSTYKKDITVKFDLYEKEGVKYYFLVNPDDEVVKVYKLVGFRYVKIGDFSDEVLEIELDKCDKKFKIDFSNIWK